MSPHSAEFNRAVAQAYERVFPARQVPPETMARIANDTETSSVILGISLILQVVMAAALVYIAVFK